MNFWKTNSKCKFAFFLIFKTRISQSYAITLLVVSQVNTIPDGVLLIPVLKLICPNKIYCLWDSRENGKNHELSFFQYFFFQIIVLCGHICVPC